MTSVKNWFDAYKNWETTDTLEAAYKEKRLTVKGSGLMDQTIQAFERTVPPRDSTNPEPMKALYGTEPWPKEPTA